MYTRTRTHTHVHTHTHTCTHAHAHTCTCMYTHTYAHACTHTHTCTHAYACTHTCTRTHTHAHVRTHMPRARALTHTAELTILLNATLEVMMASATTETDQTTAFAFLEALEGVLRACKGKSQMDGKTTKELLQGIQDFLTKQVTWQPSTDSVSYNDKHPAIC